MNDLEKFSRQQIEQGSKSFAMAARLFDPSVRNDAYLLYAWCRHCDDVVDGQALGHERTDKAEPRDLELIVADLDGKTRAAMSGNATDPAFECLAKVCEKHDMPERYPLDLIEGFRMDATNRRYETLQDTVEYSYYVAGVVGVMMSIIMGQRASETLNSAAALGIGFQLTNIARDVVVDHKNGRIYLPDDWLQEAGLDHPMMIERANRSALAEVTSRLLTTADAYYEAASCGIPALPLRSAWAVATAQITYRAIGDGVRRRGSAAWDQRVSTSRVEKFKFVAQGFASALASRRADAASQSGRGVDLWTMPCEA